MSDDYRKGQDRMFREMEDRRLMAAAVEANAVLEAKLKAAGVTIDGLMATWATARKIRPDITPLEVLQPFLDSKADE